MGLVKCPDCGKMISDKVVGCPNCGCPSEFFNISNNNEKDRAKAIDSRENEEAYTFCLCGKYRLTYTGNVKEFAFLYGLYFKRSIEAVTKMKILYNEAKNADNIQNKVIPYGVKLLDENIEMMVKDLYTRGITISTDHFKKEYGGIRYYDKNNDFGYLGECKIVKDLLNDAKVLAESLDNAEARRKASRGRWVGGGFGVKGALKGAATAAALNVGTDFLRSFGDATRASSNNSIVNNKKNRIYNASNVSSAVCDYLGTAIMNAFDAYTTVLKENDILSKITINPYEAEEIFENAMKYGQEDTERFTWEIVRSIGLNPCELKYYKAILPYVVASTEDDIAAFLEFWNLSFLLPNYMEKRKIGIKFDKEWTEKMQKQSQWKKSNRPESYAETRKFCYKFFKDNKIESLPEYSFFADDLREYYEMINLENINGITNHLKAHYAAIEWIPEDISFNEFIEYIYFERESFYPCYRNFWIKGDEGEECGDDDDDDDDYYDIPLNKFSREFGISKNNIFLFMDESSFWNSSKGILMTDEEIIDVGHKKRIYLSELRDCGVYEEKNYPVYFKDKDTEIILKFPDELEKDSAIYISLLVQVIAVRYAGNPYIENEKMTSRPNKNMANSHKTDLDKTCQTNRNSLKIDDYKEKQDEIDLIIEQACEGSIIASKVTYSDKPGTVCLFNDKILFISNNGEKRIEFPINKLKTFVVRRTSLSLQNQGQLLLTLFENFEDGDKWAQYICEKKGGGYELRTEKVSNTEDLNSNKKVNDTMFCPYCGNKIERKAKFCNFCGKTNDYNK